MFRDYLPQHLHSPNCALLDQTKKTPTTGPTPIFITAEDDGGSLAPKWSASVIALVASYLFIQDRRCLRLLNTHFARSILMTCSFVFSGKSSPTWMMILNRAVMRRYRVKHWNIRRLVEAKVDATTKTFPEVTQSLDRNKLRVVNVCIDGLRDKLAFTTVQDHSESNTVLDRPSYVPSIFLQPLLDVTRSQVMDSLTLSRVFVENGVIDLSNFCLKSLHLKHVVAKRLILPRCPPYLELSVEATQNFEKAPPITGARRPGHLDSDHIVLGPERVFFGDRSSYLHLRSWITPEIKYLHLERIAERSLIADELDLSQLKKLESIKLSWSNVLVTLPSTRLRSLEIQGDQQAFQWPLPSEFDCDDFSGSHLFPSPYLTGSTPTLPENYIFGHQLLDHLNRVKGRENDVSIKDNL